MQELTNVQPNLVDEIGKLNRELSLLKEKDRRNADQIKLLQRQLDNYELAANKSEDKYQNLFENSLIGMFRTDVRTGEILYANPMVWKILKCDPQEGASTLNFYANPEDRANLLRDLKENGKVQDREIQVKTADGGTTWATFSAVFYSESNTIEGVMMDISKIKDSVVELQKANYELDNFVYHASHDLRSPLRSIMGLINLLRLEKTTSGKENCLELIEGSIKRLDMLVIDLLQISKGNRSGNSKEEVSFVSEINNSITNFYHVDDSEGIRIITKVNQPVDFISDLTRIRIILNNLISNAIKYRSNKREESYILVEAIVTKEQVLIKIEDNGEGIPKGKLSSIFDMFYRATDNNQGSGLGLYIVKNVVEKLGGKIRVTSEENCGTVFELNIPNLQS